jgi:tRNA(fMet)-specific endonuclease VapC
MEKRAGLIVRIDNIPSFDADAGNACGMSTARHPGRTSGFDRLLAAHAIAAGVKLIANNPGDFALYPDNGLVVENRARCPFARSPCF